MTQPTLAKPAEADTLMTNLQQRESAIFSGGKQGTSDQQMVGRRQRTAGPLLTWNPKAAPTTKVKTAQRFGKPIEHRVEFVRRFYQ